MCHKIGRPPISIIGLGYIAGQGRIAAYLVEVDKLQPVARRAAGSHAGNVDPRVIKAYLARFVEDWRDVTVDRQAQKEALARAYAMLPRNSVALRKVNDYFAANNPFVPAKSGPRP